MDIEPQTLADPTAQEDLDAWAYVELFGHSKIAGRVTTRKLGTEIMFQIDVPKGETEFSHSHLYSPKAIFSINPTTEAWCRKWAKAAQNYGREVLPYIPPAVETHHQLTNDESEHYED